LTKRNIALAAIVIVAAAAVLAVGTSAGSAKSSGAFKAAWIYVGPHNDGGWSQAHDQGRLHVQKTLGSKVHDPKQYLVHPYAIADYDAIMIASLAMTEAKSTKGSDFNKLITQVTAPKAGATVVHSYAEGVRALKAGKKIQYIGTSGSLVFNKYHSAPSAFAQFRFDPKTKQPVVVKLIPGSKIA